LFFEQYQCQYESKSKYWLTILKKAADMRSSSSCITWLLSTALWHVAIGVVKADVFDDAIRHAMKTESIPGVAVAFYDGVREKCH
jgi:hypothetical protein